MSYVELSAEQAVAASQITAFIEADSVSKPYLVMHGNAGTGKTTTLGAVGRQFPGAWVCTLSGRAADVLRRKTGANAMTIHSAFYKLQERGQFSDGRDRMRWKDTYAAGELDGTILMLDEVSQINKQMAEDLLRTGCRIIACGDPFQLPPIDGAQFFDTPDILLKKVRRQALDSAVLRQAHLIRLGRGYKPDGANFQVVDRLPRGLLKEVDVVLCWKNATRRMVNQIVRRERGILTTHPQAGEMVMCLTNNRDHGIFNGATYELLQDFKEGDNRIHIMVDGMSETVRNARFEGFQDTVPKYEKALSFTYSCAATVHKAQGSEWSSVVLIDEYTRSEARDNWLYTGVTRAAERITIVRQ